jgi:PIN domain nuclease of toxin-antitoxin system
LWYVVDDPQLTDRIRQAIADTGNECLVSIASCWEMAVKLSLGK